MIIFKLKMLLINNIPLSDIIASLGGLATIWVVVWTVVNVKSRKKIECAKAEKTQAEADRAHYEASDVDLANLKERTLFLINRVQDLEKELAKSYETLADTRKSLLEAKDLLWVQQCDLIEYSRAIGYSDSIRCDDLDCLGRVPPRKNKPATQETRVKSVLNRDV